MGMLRNIQRWVAMVLSFVDADTASKIIGHLICTLPPIVMGLIFLINQRTYSAKVRTEGTYICWQIVRVSISDVFTGHCSAVTWWIPPGEPAMENSHERSALCSKKNRNYLLEESVMIFRLFFMWIIHCVKFGSLNRNWSKKQQPTSLCGFHTDLHTVSFRM